MTHREIELSGIWGDYTFIEDEFLFRKEQRNFTTWYE